MDCCYSDHGCNDDYEVTPILKPPCCGCYDDEPACYPRLPACQNACCQKPPKAVCCHEVKPPKVVYCHEVKPPKPVYCREVKPPKVMYCYESKPPKVMFCCDEKPPKFVYCKPKPVCKECCSPCDHSPPSCQHSPQGCRRAVPCCHECEPCCKPVKTVAPCCHECEPCCKPVKTKYIIPCYRYEDGRIVRQLPVTAFKRNGMQDQEHSKLLGTVNFLERCPRDVSIECEACVNSVKVADPAKVPPCCTKPAALCGFMRKRPVERNQTTVLMRRACEVACGARARRALFVDSTCHADPDHEVRRYHAEDERGNCCYHCERKKHKCCESTHICNPCVPTGMCVSSPGCEYVSSLVAERGNNLSACYYCK